MDKTDPAENEHEPSPDSDFASIIETEPDKSKRASKRKAANSDHKKSYRRSWRSASPLTKLMIYFTALAAISTLVYAVFAGWQWHEIHSGGEETRRLAQAARDSADAAQRQATIAVEQLQAVKDAAQAAKDSASAANTAIEQNRDLVKAAQTQANTSQASAAAAVENAQIAAKSLYVGNRPYIGVGDVTGVNMADGQVPEFTVRFKNTGNTPARDLRVVVQVDPRTDPLPENPVYNKSIQQSQTLMTTGSVFAIKITNPLPIKQGGTAILKAHKTFVYLHGMATYKDDLSDRCHVLRFCTLYNPDSGNFEWCGYYNREEDQPKCPKPN